MRRAVLLVVCVALGSLSANAQQAPTREHLAPTGWEGSYHDLHYTPVLRIGDRVIVSGIPALEGDTDEAKIRWAFQQMEAHLKAAGATMAERGGVAELSCRH
jgi:enamine deaminase RidA (YjgF/YER057c/UK114 family)